MHALKSNFNISHIDKFTLTPERNVHNLMGLDLLFLFQKLLEVKEMNKEDFLDWLRGVLIVVLITSLVVGVIVGVFRLVDNGAREGCERLGDRIGYNTNRFSGACHIEIFPNLWVSEYSVAEFLPLIDCGEERMKRVLFLGVNKFQTLQLYV